MHPYWAIGDARENHQKETKKEQKNTQKRAKKHQKKSQKNAKKEPKKTHKTTRFLIQTVVREVRSYAPP